MTQLALFHLSAAAPRPPAWQKIRSGNHGGCGAVWEHASGWQLIHCGHPTANFPWYGVSPDGRERLIHPNGMAFRLLRDAKAAVEARVDQGVSP